MNAIRRSIIRSAALMRLQLITQFSTPHKSSEMGLFTAIFVALRYRVICELFMRSALMEVLD
jgi:hypothetical protein